MLSVLKLETSEDSIFALMAIAPKKFGLKEFFSISDFVWENTPSATIK